LTVAIRGGHREDRSSIDGSAQGQDQAARSTRRYWAREISKFGHTVRLMMSGSAGFHADQARRNLAKEVNDLLAAPR
jgi:hypothetical protein